MTPVPTAATRRPLDSARSFLVRLGPSLGLLLVWVLFALLKGRDFMTWSNQRLMLLQTAVVATAAIGATLVIISGGIDLSVGSAIAFGTMVIALALQLGVAPALAALVGILSGFALGVAVGAMIVGRVGCIAGLLSGAVLTYAVWGHLPSFGAIGLGIFVALGMAYLLDRVIGVVPLSPFIVTLGMWVALRGAAKGLGDNQPIYPDQTWLTDLMQPAQRGPFAVLSCGRLVDAGTGHVDVGGAQVHAIRATRLCHWVE